MKYILCGISSTWSALRHKTDHQQNSTCPHLHGKHFSGFSLPNKRANFLLDFTKEKKYLMLVSCNFILTKEEIFPKWNFGRKLYLLWAVLQHQIEKTLIFHLGLTKVSWNHKGHSRSRRFWRSLHLWHSLWQNLWHCSTLTSVKSAFNLFSVENCNTRE